MAGKATSEQESWWVLQAQSGSREALDELFKSVPEPLFCYSIVILGLVALGTHVNRGIAHVLKAVELLK